MMDNEWDLAARLRREQIEAGKDLTFSKVFVPIYSSLVSSLRPSSILEAGAGTGHLALELSRLVPARYVAVEPSKGMMAEAADVLRGRPVTLLQTCIEDFSTDESFDMILSHMCLQTVDKVVEFLSAVARRLATGGVYLISIPHPAFFNNYKRVLPVETFSYMHEQGALINFTISLDPLALIRKVPYFHRPLSKYFKAFSDAGLSVTYMKEIFPSNDVQALYGSPWQTPRYLLWGGSLREGATLDAITRPLSEKLLALLT